MRLLGLDIGEKTIGLAICEEAGQPRPLYTLRRSSRKRELQHLRELVERYRIDRIVVGLPLNMDGTAGPAAERARFFAQWLEEQLQRPTDTCDERLSTVEAEERLQAMSLSPARCAERIDAVAAAVILEDYLQLPRKDSGYDGPSPADSVPG